MSRVNDLHQRYCLYRNREFVWWLGITLLAMSAGTFFVLVRNPHHFRIDSLEVLLGAILMPGAAWYFYVSVCRMEKVLSVLIFADVLVELLATRGVFPPFAARLTSGLIDLGAGVICIAAARSRKVNAVNLSKD